MTRYALILFDEDGCTAVVDTKKLSGKGKLQRSSVCNLGMPVGEQYKVEILEISDSKIELNKFESTWSKSQRSVALDEAKRKRGHVLGGYLSVWPDDLEMEQIRERENDGSESAVAPPAREESQSRKRKHESGRTATSGKMKRKTSSTSTITNDSERTQSTIITGTNNRKVTVLFEGAGDYSGQGSSPKRSPFFTGNLTKDQSATQTSEVVVLESEKDVVNLLEREAVNKETQCNLCVCDTNSKKLDELLIQVGLIKDKLDEKLNASLISVDLLESLTVPVQQETRNEDKKEYTGEGEDQPHEEKTDGEQNQVVSVVQEVNEVAIVCPDENRVEGPEDNYEYAASLLPNIQHILSSPGPVNYKMFSRPCSVGGIVEISSHRDLPSKDCELRIHPEVQRSVKNIACSVGNFGWLLTKVLFTCDDLTGKNYSGRKGKLCLSPRRIHAIEHACADTFGQGDNVKLLSNAVNAGMRNLNMNRQPFRSLFENN